MIKNLLTTIGIGITMTLSAQNGIIETRNIEEQGDKILTMEETILGYHLQAQNQRYQWRGSLAQLTTVTQEGITSIGVKAKETDKVIISIQEISEITGEEFTRLTYKWLDNTHIALSKNGTYYKINIEEKSLDYKFSIPKGATNFTSSSNDYFAYTIDNNLYICDKEGKQTAITENADKNIVSGQTVSRNEFGINGGIFWSKDGSKLAFYTKDESNVSTFPLLDINSRTGSLKEIKYPMAGMASEIVTLSVYDLASAQKATMQVTDFDKEKFLTNITFSPNNENIYIQVLSRSQKEMKLNIYSTADGSYIKTVLEEKNDKFVEPLHPVFFLQSDNTKFLYITNNRDGYRNIYLCNNDGIIKRLTKTEADVEYLGQDKENIYYTSAEVSPIENHLFKYNLKKDLAKRLTEASGWHNIMISGDCSKFLDVYSSLNTPRKIELRNSKNGKLAKDLFTAKDPVKDYNFGEIVLGSVKSADGKYDNYYRLIKPANFDPNKKYPTIVYVYGGPHSQLVQNTWLGQLRMWEMYMAQKGYVVYVQDNRGTFNRGAEFEKAIYGECGQAEMADQMVGVEMLKSLPYVDSDRIGVHGWSYGGFMTISLITNYPETFKVAVAGGPVIDWKWYEIMYGERYMGNPKDNAAGYEKVSLINKAADLKGKLLICQGAIDNVVVWQHSLSFVRQCVIKGVQLDYFPYPCHEHNVRGKDRIHLMNKVTQYFEDYL